MADINLGATVAPGGPFPIVRDTDLLGGFRVVATTVARDAIITANKVVGMFVFVQADSTLYRLASTGPDVWVAFTTGGTSVSVASWATTATRYYTVDYDAGSDSNAGFSDVSAAAAGLVAKKTIQGLRDVLPVLGNGRSVDVIIKARAAGATYLKQDGVTAADLDLRGYTGYVRLSVRGTDTIASASSVAFAGDANEEISQGGRTATGTNAAGYKLAIATSTVVSISNAAPIVVTHDGTGTFVSGERVTFSGGTTEDGAQSTAIDKFDGWIITVINGTSFSLNNSDGTTAGLQSAAILTRIKVTKADNSAAALPTDATAKGWRLRGASANTAGFQNSVNILVANTTDTIVFGNDYTPSAPDPADIFYIEEPNAAFVNVLGDGPNSILVSGIRATGKFLFGNFSDLSLSFCQSAGATSNGGFGVTAGNTVFIWDSWRSPSNALRGVGGNKATSTGNISVSLIGNAFISGLASGAGAGVSVEFSLCKTLNLAFGNFAQNIAVLNCGANAVSDRSPDVVIGPVRFTAGSLTVVGGAQVAVVSFEGTTNGVPVITLEGVGSKMSISRVHDGRTITGPTQNKWGVQVSGTGCRVALSELSVFLRANPNVNSVSGRQRSEFGLSDMGWLARDLRFSDFADQFDNRVSFVSFVGSGEEPHAVVISTPMYTRNDGAATVARFQVGKITSIDAGPPIIRQVGLAQADTVANASGELLVAGNSTFGLVGQAPIAAHAQGVLWAISDDLPASGDIIYLSPTTPGNVTKTSPAADPIVQKRRLGIALESLVDGGINYVLLNWRPELLSVNADGLP